MSYNLDFHPKALQEWHHLNDNIQAQLKKKLAERLKNPKVAKDKLKGYEQAYKIKLKSAGYRLAYQVKDNELVVLVLVVEKRENDKVYRVLRHRL